MTMAPNNAPNNSHGGYPQPPSYGTRQENNNGVSRPAASEQQPPAAGRTPFVSPPLDDLRQRLDRAADFSRWTNQQQRFQRSIARGQPYGASNNPNVGHDPATFPVSQSPVRYSQENQPTASQQSTASQSNTTKDSASDNRKQIAQPTRTANTPLRLYLHRPEDREQFLRQQQTRQNRDQRGRQDRQQPDGSPDPVHTAALFHVSQSPQTNASASSLSSTASSSSGNDMDVLNSRLKWYNISQCIFLVQRENGDWELALYGVALPEQVKTLQRLAFENAIYWGNERVSADFNHYIKFACGEFLYYYGKKQEQMDAQMDAEEAASPARTRPPPPAAATTRTGTPPPPSTQADMGAAPANTQQGAIPPFTQNSHSQEAREAEVRAEAVRIGLALAASNRAARTAGSPGPATTAATSTGPVRPTVYNVDSVDDDDNDESAAAPATNPATDPPAQAPAAATTRTAPPTQAPAPATTRTATHAPAPAPATSPTYRSGPTPAATAARTNPPPLPNFRQRHLRLDSSGRQLHREREHFLQTIERMQRYSSTTNAPHTSPNLAQAGVGPSPAHSPTDTQQQRQEGPGPVSSPPAPAEIPTVTQDEGTGTPTAAAPAAETAPGPTAAETVGPPAAAAAAATQEVDVCSICHEVMDDSNSQQMEPCGHRFHNACSDPWLYQPGRQHFTCPNCRQPVNRSRAARRAYWQQLERDMQQEATDIVPGRLSGSHNRTRRETSPAAVRPPPPIAIVDLTGDSVNARNHRFRLSLGLSESNEPIPPVPDIRHSRRLPIQNVDPEGPTITVIGPNSTQQLVVPREITRGNAPRVVYAFLGPIADLPANNRHNTTNAEALLEEFWQLHALVHNHRLEDSGPNRHFYRSSLRGFAVLSLARLVMGHNFEVSGRPGAYRRLHEFNIPGVPNNAYTQLIVPALHLLMTYADPDNILDLAWTTRTEGGRSMIAEVDMRQVRDGARRRSQYGAYEIAYIDEVAPPHLAESNVRRQAMFQGIDINLLVQYDRYFQGFLSETINRPNRAYLLSHTYSLHHVEQRRQAQRQEARTRNATQGRSTLRRASSSNDENIAVTNGETSNSTDQSGNGSNNTGGTSNPGDSNA